MEFTQKGIHNKHNFINERKLFLTGYVKNSEYDLDCNQLDEHGQCEYVDHGMLLVLEYSNDRWKNLGTLVTKSLFLILFLTFPYE